MATGPARQAQLFVAHLGGDAALGALDLWHAFEAENPSTFAGMYLFWAQAA